jgi:hypothetical protein
LIWWFFVVVSSSDNRKRRRIGRTIIEGRVDQLVITVTRGKPSCHSFGIPGFLASLAPHFDRITHITGDIDVFRGILAQVGSHSDDEESSLVVLADVVDAEFLQTTTGVSVNDIVAVAIVVVIIIVREERIEAGGRRKSGFQLVLVVESE